MARQAGLIRLTGTMGDVLFYKSKYGWLARNKTRVSGHRIKTGPEFVRTRENMSEFGACSTAGKRLRHALMPFIKGVYDGGMNQRLCAVLQKIRDLDGISARGKRKVSIGIQQSAAADLLKGFIFNAECGLGRVLSRGFTLNMGTGLLEMVGFLPSRDLVWPAGATHCGLRTCRIRMDFDTGIYQMGMSDELVTGMDAAESHVELDAGVLGPGGGVELYLLKVVFYQEVNGVWYGFKNGFTQAVGVVGVGI